MAMCKYLSWIEGKEFTMLIQGAFQQLVSELYAMSSFLHFKLPVSSEVATRQVKQLVLIEQKLQLIEEKISRRFGVGGCLRAHQAYQTLIDLTEQMRLAAIHLRLLTMAQLSQAYLEWEQQTEARGIERGERSLILHQLN
jgi:hypothetical protein